jgi:hypothetical protein
MTAGLKQVYVKVTQSSLQKTTTWTKKSGKGRQEWERACVERRLWPRKSKTLMKIRFASKVIMFEKVLEFKEAIILCHAKQKVPKAKV